MKTTNSLPKYWVVKSDISNSNWKKVIAYLNKIHVKDWFRGTDDAYYGFDGGTSYKGTNVCYDLSSFKNTPVILTIEEFVEMTEGFVLPEKWCIKRDNKNDKIVTDFINDYSESIHCYLDYNRENPYLHYAKGISSNSKPWNNYTEITFEQFKKHVLKQKETMKTITHTQAQQIIDIACITWKVKLAAKWSKEIVLKETIEISDNDYQEMRKACTSEQHKLFDEIFGKDKPLFKVGDWVMFEGTFKAGPYQIKSFTTNGSALDQNGEWRDIQSQYRLATEDEIQKAQYIPEGTPCLGRDGDGYGWRLCYSNGNGRFKWTPNGKADTFEQVEVLDVNNLPKY